MEITELKAKKVKKEVKRRNNIMQISNDEENEYLKNCTNPMHHFIACLEMDCGLRPSEVRTLQVKHFNWVKKEVTVRCLKRKKGVIDYRTINLTERVINSAVNYFSKNKIKTDKEVNAEDYIFPSKHSKVSPYISRQAIFKYTNEKSDKRFRPYLFRHQFATKLNENKVDAHVIKDLMGHTSVFTAQKNYIHARTDRKREAIQTLETKQSRLWNWLKNLMPSVFRKTRTHVLPMASGWIKFHIGRKQELKELMEFAESKTNVIVLGDKGLGKSQLLDNYKADNVLRIDDTRDFRKSLASIIITLCNGDKEEVAKLLEINPEVITKESTKRLTQHLCNLTKRHEYTIIIDSVDNVTPTAVKTLEELNTHFHFIVAARNVKIEQAKFLSNFKRIDLKPLNRAETIELIVKGSEDFRRNIEDFESYKNHIINKAASNPLYTLEMIDDFRKKPYVNRAMVANSDHILARKGIDMTLPVLIFFSFFMILRYFGKQVGHDEKSYQFIGMIFIIITLMGRQLLRFTKRKYI